MASAERAVMILVVIFMVGSLLGLGLQLALGAALRALRHGKFVLQTIAWSFVLAPALAWVVARVIPMEAPYATGLILLGLAPCAPFLPMMVERARGDLAYAGATILITAVGTVVFMPLAVPVMAGNLAADAWTIGKPLLLYVLLPLVAGVATRAARPGLAAALNPVVRGVTTAATLLMLVGLVVVYGRDMMGAVGSYAIGAQVLLFGTLMSAPYHLNPRMPPTQRSVLGLGVGTRNIGAAMAPLVAVPGTDPRAVVMCAIAVVVTVALAAVAARRYARDVAAPNLAGGREKQPGTSSR